MIRTTRSFVAAGYSRATCRRWAANASCIRRVLLRPVFRLASAGLSSVLACSEPVTTLITARRYSRSLQSRVPTVRRCPLTPRAGPRVGTIGRRASSGLSSTSWPASAFFLGRQSSLDQGVFKPLEIGGRVAAEASPPGPDRLPTRQPGAQLAPGPRVRRCQLLAPDLPSSAG